MEEAETRGQHRSWYVDDMVSILLFPSQPPLTLFKDWIRSRETEDESGATTTDASTIVGTSSAVTTQKFQYLPVPDDPALKNSVCPICQEEFDTKYLDDVQEWVWMDAKQIGNKVYHASCYAEATKDVTSQIKRGTPEPVLGKRKAEVSFEQF
jgi:pre-mRNA cleavage complex 2 protein Pcf11